MDFHNLLDTYNIKEYWLRVADSVVEEEWDWAPLKWWYFMWGQDFSSFFVDRHYYDAIQNTIIDIIGSADFNMMWQF